jgi:hypothetical protein
MTNTDRYRIASAMNSNKAVATQATANNTSIISPASVKCDQLVDDFVAIVLSMSLSPPAGGISLKDANVFST